MALTARIPAAIDAAGFIPELWSSKTLEVVHNHLVCVPLTDHRWEPELTKGDTMNVGLSNTVTAKEVTVGTEGVVEDPASGAMKSIVVNQWYEAPVVIDMMSRKQSQANLESIAQREAAYAVAKVMDTSVNALFAALSGASILGTDGSAITDDVLIEAVEQLDEADVPAENRYWIFDPSSKADFLKMDKFVTSDYIRGENVVKTGLFGERYGARIYITNNLTAYSTGSYGCYMHRDAIAFIGQENLKVTRVEQPLKHQITINVESLWGVLEMRDTFGVAIYTRKA